MTLAVFGFLFLAVGGGGAYFAFRKARQLDQASGITHPFTVPHPPGAMARPAPAASPAGGPHWLTGTISSGRLANLGVASNAGAPIGVMLGQTGLVMSASDGTYQPAYWCMKQGRVHISAAADGELAPLASAVPLGEAHELLRQWAPTQELRLPTI